MQSKIYINEISPGEVIMDLSASPSELASKETCYGFAFNKTLEQLDIASSLERFSGFPSIRLSGSLEAVKTNLPRLQACIGVIARYGAEKNYGSQYSKQITGRMLGIMVQKTIPQMPDDLPFSRVVGTIVEPFAYETNDDGLFIGYNQKATWRMTALEKLVYDRQFIRVDSTPY